MRLSRLIGERFKDQPAEAVLQSHSIMLRGGYIRQVTNGIYSLLTPAKRVVKKIEEIIREEMDNIGCQEVLMPVVMPKELWEESGRYEAVGSELVRFKDRTGHHMLLGMTHEEAAVHLCRHEVRSHTKLPFAIYQIQTKFRDEPRSRGGLIRVREFTMKDAYSFHATQEDLQDFYEICMKAYDRIFARAGIPQVVSVKSDTGMMGGSVAHEYMLLCDAGEDTIAVCDHCSYMANLEVAEGILDKVTFERQELEEVHTPAVRTIEELCAFLEIPSNATGKALVYKAESSKKLIVAFIRGDLELNEHKLSKIFKSPVRPAEAEEIGDALAAGFIGPVGLDKSKFVILVDKSLEKEQSLVCGANKVDYHMKGVCLERDCPGIEYHDISKVVEGASCTKCTEGKINLVRGIEVGNVFQLGTKYTASMNMKYTDKDGSSKTPIMGCYGIGVGRLMASVLEVSRDDYGPIWPISIAPWQVHICAIRLDDEKTKEVAEGLYQSLTKQGYEVVYDDRNNSAGFQFADADLLGVPVRVVVSPKNLAEGVVELKSRDKKINEKVKLEELEEKVKAYIRQMKEELA